MTLKKKGAAAVLAAAESLASPVAIAVARLVATEIRWAGTAEELLAAFARDEPQPGTWPKDAPRLAAELRRSVADLKECGVFVSFQKTNGTRQIVLLRGDYEKDVRLAKAVRALLDIEDFDYARAKASEIRSRSIKEDLLAEITAAAEKLRPTTGIVQESDVEDWVARERDDKLLFKLSKAAFDRDENTVEAILRQLRPEAQDQARKLLEQTYDLQERGIG